MSDAEPQITVNGRPHPLRGDLHVEQLLVDLGLSSSPCAVEVNRRLIPKSGHRDCRLRPDDSVELVTLVGGG